MVVSLHFLLGLLSGTVICLTTVLIYITTSPTSLPTLPPLRNRPVSVLRILQPALKETNKESQWMPPAHKPIKDTQGLTAFRTKNIQDYNHTVADTLYQKVKVLCMLMTTDKELETKAKFTYDKWAHKCTELVYVSDKMNKSFPATVIDANALSPNDNIDAGTKTLNGFKYVWDSHSEHADWFIKADDTTFVIMENLRSFLATKNPQDPAYYSRNYNEEKNPKVDGFNSEGAGFVLSKEALQRLVTKGYPNKTLCNRDGDGDMMIGRCLKKLGVKFVDTLDQQGKTRFHSDHMEAELEQSITVWHKEYNVINDQPLGVSYYPITFHNMLWDKMSIMAYYSDQLKAYGLREHNKLLLNEYYNKQG